MSSRTRLVLPSVQIFAPYMVSIAIHGAKNRGCHRTAATLDETERGIFCSYLISKTYAKHIAMVGAVGNGYGVQIGGLALATVAVTGTEIATEFQ